MPPLAPRGAAPGRVANFFSDDEDHSSGEGAEAAPLTAQSKRKALSAESSKKKKQKKKGKDGKEGKDKKVNGKAGEGKKKVASADDVAAEAKRAKIAAELLVKRYELPFYQGTFTP